MLKVEHIGIAVKDLSKSIPLFELLLSAPCYKTEQVDSEKVTTAFFRQGDTKVELLQSSSEDGVIAKFIREKGEGIHHIAFEVTDIESEMERLRAAGIRLVQQQVRKGADNKWICFVHPKDSNGVLIELCMKDVKTP